MNRSYILYLVAALYFYSSSLAFGVECEYKGGNLEDLWHKIDKATNAKQVFSNTTRKAYLDCLLIKARDEKESLSGIDKKIVDAWYSLLDRQYEDVDDYGEPY